MTRATLPPPMAPTLAPAYHLLSNQPRAFEELAADLLRREKGFANVSLYGVSGQRQFGVDVVGERYDGDRDVMSCKCYESTTAHLIRVWSDEFLGARQGRWRNVKRFILMTSATNVMRTEIVEQCRDEASRFAAAGILYEVWGPAVITDRIGQSDGSLAARHLSPAWAQHIFDMARNAEPPAAAGPDRRPEIVVSGSEISELMCVELSVQTTQGSVPERFELLVEVLFGTDDVEHLSDIIRVGVKESWLGLLLEGGVVAQGTRLGDEPHPHIGVRPRGQWVIRGPREGAILVGRALGAERLCVVESPKGTVDFELGLVCRQRDLALANDEGALADDAWQRVQDIFLSRCLGMRGGLLTLTRLTGKALERTT